MIAVSPFTPERDRWGRPLITPPDGGKAIAYTRATTVAETLDDQHALTDWAQRITAAGLVRRPDLLALIASKLTPEGDIPEDAKRQVQAWCNEAKEAARSSAAANMGTALHAMTELLDTGQSLGAVPGNLQADLDAYRATTAGFTWLGVEQFVVLDEYKVAGTFDRLADISLGAVIADLKTGQNLDYSWRSIAVQLAIYAHGELYDGKERSDLPAWLNKDVALVIHLPAGQARCDLYEVDIAAGWEAFQRSMWTRTWRNRKNLARPFSVGVAGARPDAPTPTEPTPRAATLARLRNLTDDQRALVKLRWRWDVAAKDLPDTELPALLALIDDVARDTGAPFTDTESPQVTPQPQPVVEVKAPPVAFVLPPDGGPLDDDTIDALRTHVRAAPAAVQAWMQTRTKEARIADRPISGNTVRWFEQARALLAAGTVVTGTWGGDDELLRCVLCAAMGDETAMQPAFMLGAIFGSLTIDQARNVTLACEACIGQPDRAPVGFDAATGAATLAA